MTMPRTLIVPLAALVLAACGNAPVAPPSSGHIQAETTTPAKEDIPPPVMATVILPKPVPAPKVETYGVVVNNVKVHELLFALARDAKINVDIHPGIEGTITLNAIDQTLPQLLTRIARQVDMRWEIDGQTLSVMPDTPYLHTYKVDYVNMSRDTAGLMTVTTQVAATPGAMGATGVPGMAGATGAGSNNSQTRVENKVQHHFWETLEKNIKDILRETDKILPEGSSETIVERAELQETTGTGAPPSRSRRAATAAAQGIAASPNPVSVEQSGTTVVKRTTFREAASVITNPETGIVIVRATSRQHEKIREFLNHVMSAARRQVLIEATVAEVSLSDNYQQGINWEALPLGRAGFHLIQKAVGGIAAPASSILELGYVNQASRVGNISASVKLLDAFGTVKVLSSPKLSVLNNQTAVLKVVDNLVYFTIKADTAMNANTATTTYTTTLNSVPVGLVMNVTPQISENDAVLLNVRPSISRKFGEVVDPNPALQNLNIKSAVPLIRTREMESMIRIQNGNIAVMGGLMEDALENTDHAVPGLAGVPVIGNAFQNRDDTRRKTELVVFLRPVVVKDASIEGDYAAFRDKLPGQDFFDRALGPGRRLIRSIP